jgi:hypothetical protein
MWGRGTAEKREREREEEEGIREKRTGGRGKEGEKKRKLRAKR